MYCFMNLRRDFTSDKHYSGSVLLSWKRHDSGHFKTPEAGVKTSLTLQRGI